MPTLPLKIVVVNPNSDPEMTEVIRKSARNFAAGRFGVECVRNPDGPAFIDSYAEQLRAGPGTLALIREHEAWRRRPGPSRRSRACRCWTGS